MSVKEIKNSKDNYQESQAEEEKTKRKTSKLIAYPSTRMCKLVSVMYNASSNSQIGMLEKPAICRIKLIKIVPN